MPEVDLFAAEGNSKVALFFSLHSQDWGLGNSCLHERLGSSISVMSFPSKAAASSSEVCQKRQTSRKDQGPSDIPAVLDFCQAGADQGLLRSTFQRCNPQLIVFSFRSLSSRNRL